MAYVIQNITNSSMTFADADIGGSFTIPPGGTKTVNDLDAPLYQAQSANLISISVAASSSTTAVGVASTTKAVDTTKTAVTSGHEAKVFSASTTGVVLKTAESELFGVYVNALGTGTTVDIYDLKTATLSGVPLLSIVPTAPGWYGFGGVGAKAKTGLVAVIGGTGSCNVVVVYD